MSTVEETSTKIGKCAARIYLDFYKLIISVKTGRRRKIPVSDNKNETMELDGLRGDSLTSKRTNRRKNRG